MQHSDVIVIGGGAAGLMCAITAGQRGRSVLVLEGANKIGKKILMSGGGRCNFTNLHTDPSNFLSANPHFCKSALSRYTQSDIVALVEQHGIAYHEKKLGQLFCDDSSKAVVTMLLQECEAAGVRILTHSTGLSVEFEDHFVVSCVHGRYSSDSLVVASGGLSIPRMGASDFGYRLARQFKLRVTETRAALVPFTCTGNLHALCSRLAGLSCRVSITVRNTVFTENMLFTHRGLSGPAILQASSYFLPGNSLGIDLLPDIEVGDYLLAAKSSRPRSLLRGVLAELLPRALVAELQQLFWSDVGESTIASLPDTKLLEVAAALRCWSIKPAATEGYRTAEVTMGGVSTDELSSQTMECKSQTGLYFIGEVVDVTGQLGGFNFQWAWSSGYAAGQAV